MTETVLSVNSHTCTRIASKFSINAVHENDNGTNFVTQVIDN